MSISIRSINPLNKKERDAFIMFPWKIYKGNPYWVAPLIMDMRAKMSPKHPFYEFGEIAFYMAYRGEEPVGRIAAIRNGRYNDFHKCTTGFWGFFECIDDQSVADLLFSTAEKWLKEKGLTSAQGPVNPSTNYEAGLLIEGFDDEPRLMMTYNPEYYVRLVENYGFKKAMGMFAYKIEKEKLEKAEKVMRVQALVRERFKVSTRPISVKNIKTEIELVKHIYNKSWESNWGFAPMSDAEIDAMGAELKMLVVEDMFQFLLNENGDVIGMVMALPDYNYILKQMNGRLFPFNFLKLFTQKKNIKWARVILLGILPEYRNKGLDAVLYSVVIESGLRRGYHLSEGSWILETNAAMNRGLEALNAHVYKKYNVYERPL